MNIIDSYINYGERKLGQSFPDAASLPPQIDNMDPVVEPLLSREQSAFLARTALAMGKNAVANVMHPVNTVRSALEAAAGSEYPTRDRVKALVAGDCDTQNEIDNEVGWRRRKWWKDLKHKNGLTQALQQGETR